MTDVNEAKDVEAADGEQTRRSSHCYAGDNRVLRYFWAIRPQLWDAPDFEKTAFVLQFAINEGKAQSGWEEITDALAEIMPNKREFWLRVQATWNIQFIEAMTAGFTTDEIDDESAVRMGMAMAIKSGEA